MEKMNQVSVSEFMSKSKEEMYDMAVEMVKKYNRLVDICNDSAERMAELMAKDDINEFKKELQSREPGELKIQKLADIVAWADSIIRDAGYNEEKYQSDGSTAYCHVKAHELWRIRDVALKSMERHTVYSNALNNDIAEKAAKIDLLEKEIEGRKEGYTALKKRMDTDYISIEEHNNIVDPLNKEIERLNRYSKNLETANHNLVTRVALLEPEIEKLKKSFNALKEEMATRYITIETHNSICETYDKKIAELEKELADRNVKIRHQKENLDGINKTLEIRTKENESLIKVRNNLNKEIEAHENENKRLSERLMKLNGEVNKLNRFLKMQEDFTRDWKNKYVEAQKEIDEWESDTGEHETIVQQQEYIDGLNKDVKYWKEAFETQATSLAEVRKCNDDLVDTLNKSSDRVEELEKQVKYLEKELNKTCTTKELDLKGHNRREMALVNELADKNDEIKSLKEENSYLKSEIKQKQNIIKKAYERYSDDIIKTRKDLMEVAYRDIEKDNGYVGFKLYVKSALIEAKGDKNEANEIITEAVRSAYTEWDKTQKENEKTIKKAIKEVMNKKYGYAGEIAFRIRSEVDKKRIVDIGEGAEKILGVSRELFDAAIKALVDDGYQEIIGRIPKATNSYVYMDMHVLATPDVETRETANAENIKSLDFDIPCGEDSIE